MISSYVAPGIRLYKARSWRFLRRMSARMSPRLVCSISLCGIVYFPWHDNNLYTRLKGSTAFNVSSERHIIVPYAYHQSAYMFVCMPTYTCVRTTYKHIFYSFVLDKTPDCASVGQFHACDETRQESREEVWSV